MDETSPRPPKVASEDADTVESDTARCTGACTDPQSGQQSGPQQQQRFRNVAAILIQGALRATPTLASATPAVGQTTPDNAGPAKPERSTPGNSTTPKPQNRSNCGNHRKEPSPHLTRVDDSRRTGSTAGSTGNTDNTDDADDAATQEADKPGSPKS
jgi:hypothetical protein